MECHHTASHDAAAPLPVSCAPLTPHIWPCGPPLPIPVCPCMLSPPLAASPHTATVSQEKRGEGSLHIVVAIGTQCSMRLLVHVQLHATSPSPSLPAPSPRHLPLCQLLLELAGGSGGSGGGEHDSWGVLPQEPPPHPSPISPCWEGGQGQSAATHHPASPARSGTGGKIAPPSGPTASTLCHRLIQGVAWPSPLPPPALLFGGGSGVRCWKCSTSLAPTSTPLHPLCHGNAVLCQSIPVGLSARNGVLP